MIIINIDGEWALKQHSPSPANPSSRTDVASLSDTHPEIDFPENAAFWLMSAH